MIRKVTWRLEVSTSPTIYLINLQSTQSNPQQLLIWRRHTIKRPREEIMSVRDRGGWPQNYLLFLVGVSTHGMGVGRACKNSSQVSRLEREDLDLVMLGYFSPSSSAPPPVSSISVSPSCASPASFLSTFSDRQIPHWKSSTCTARRVIHLTAMCPRTGSK